MAYEKALIEFRQVAHVERHWDGGDQYAAPIRYLYHSIQQRWKIENGTPYSPPLNGPPDSKADEFMGVIDGRPMWQPMRFVWRDLPVVSEEEAKQDSQ